MRRIKSFEHAVHQLYESRKISQYKKDLEKNLLEIFLPRYIDEVRAGFICAHFRKMYGFDSMFFAKTHSIKVYYEN